MDQPLLCHQTMLVITRCSQSFGSDNGSDSALLSGLLSMPKYFANSHDVDVLGRVIFEISYLDGDTDTEDLFLEELIPHVKAVDVYIHT